MRKFLLSAVILVFLFPQLDVKAQCTNNNTFLLNYTPACNNTSENITNCIMGGQYVSVDVVAGNVYTFSTCGSNTFDSQITIYNSSGGGALGYNDDGCGTQSTLTWTSTFTGSLWVLVDLFNCANNTTCMSLNVTCGAAPPAAAGDEPCTATVLTVSTSCTTVSSTTAGATASSGPPAPGCASYNGFDVWFTAVVPASGSLSIQTQANVITDGGMALYSGASCSALSLIQCFDDVNGNSMPSAVINQTPGTTVYIRVWEYGGNNNGAFGICAFDNSPPPSSACLSPLPDICSGACDLGTLPTPPACSSGATISNGSPLTFNLSNEGAVHESPFSAVSGCSITGSDVWYRFRSTGTQLVLSIASLPGNPLNTPNVSLYNGNNCNALLPLTCFTGTGGNLSATFAPITPNDYYYLQISGGTVTDMGDFTLVIRNNYDCDNCLLAQDLQVTPAPLNGTYGAGQTVQFCFTVSNYNQTAANWIHGIDLNFGPGWNPSTLTATSIPAPCATTAGASWGFYNSVTGTASGTTYGPGFFYETSSGNSGGVTDGNPGNNFGDVGVSTTCPRTFCWRITTMPAGSCTPGASLAVAINTLGDYESGSWTSSGCVNDPIVNFSAALACCAPPALVIGPATCGAADGKIVATGQGSPPWDYVWSDSTGAVVATHNNVNGPDSITGLSAGNYTLTVSDNLGCSVGSAATVTTTNGSAVVAGNGGPYCVGQTIALTSTTGLGYSWSGPGSFTSTQQNPTRASATTAMGGVYTVTVTFAGGCTATATTTVVVTTAPVVAISPGTSAICSGGSITLTASGGTGYLWSNGGNTAAITVSPTANTTYTVTVSNGASCTATASRLVIINAAPVAAIAPATVTICNGASATLTASGGGTYLWSNAGNTAAITVSPTATTTYTVTVTGANTCTATTSRIVNVNQTPVAAITPPSAAICTGTSATLTASGGTTYIWSNAGNTAAITVSPTTNTTYTVTVTDANTCTATASATVTVNALPVAAVSPAATSVCPGGSTTLTASGGTTYLWSNAANTAAITVSPVANTTYAVTVTDGNNCSSTASATVTISASATATITPVNPVICNGASTTLTASGGASYLWSTSATTTSITDSPPADATYSVTVTDANGCSGTASTLVTVVPTMSLSGFVNNVSCNGLSDGGINIAVGSGQSPYTYLWSNNAVTQSLSSVPAGTYSLTVTDAAQCTATVTATITQPTVFTVTETHTNVLCNGAASGSITLTAAGGTVPYNYIWNDGNTQPNRTALTAGTYSVVATDNHQCSATLSIVITEPTLLIVSETHTNVTCNGTATGSIDITTNGGTAPYSYAWNDLVNSEDRTAVPAGNYTLTVYDTYQCSATVTVTITEPAPFTVITQASTNATCYGTNTGSIDVTAAGGVQPYGYYWNDAVVTEDRTAIPAGTYLLTVTDANVCTAGLTVIITEPTALSITETHTNISCGGGADGSIDITTSGSTAPYSYAWNDAVITEDRSNLSLGTYIITVTDLNQCSGSLSINIGSASNLNVTGQSTNVLCNGGTDGTITTTVTGGTQPYTYLWNDAVITPNRSAIPAGNYSVTVSDLNLCQVSASFTISEPALLTTTETHTDVTCNGGYTGSIDITTTGGTMPYTFAWSDMVYTEDRTAIAAGNYTLIVYDTYQCSTTQSIVIAEPALLTIAETHTDVACNAASTGAIDITVTGGALPYSYLWNDAAVSEDRTAIPAGNYSVVATDANLCSVGTSVTITEPTPIIATETHTRVTCFGGNDATITITASQGTAPYTYLWNDNQTTPSRTGLAANTYTVVVSDISLCSVSLSVTIDQPAAIVLTETHTDATCLGYSDGTATVDAVGGIPPYNYAWSNSSIIPGNTGLMAGTYNVVVYDVNQCSATIDVVIGQPAGMVMNNTFTNPSCPTNSPNGTITLNIAGGSLPYNYSWNKTAVTGAQLTNLQPGDYIITVTDANNCSVSDSFTLAYLYDFAVDATPSVDIDYGETTTLGYTLTGTTGNYTSIWSPGASLSCTDCVDPVASPTTTTVYYIEVTNEAGCVARDMVTVAVVPDYTIFVPTAFTPNNDGNNDVFQVFGNLKAIAYLQMQIFNRWGEKIFESNNHQFTWDGSYRGEMQPPGIYTWQLKLTYLNGHREELRKGTVTLIK